MKNTKYKINNKFEKFSTLNLILNFLIKIIFFLMTFYKVFEYNLSFYYILLFNIQSVLKSITNVMCYIYIIFFYPTVSY